jgi:AbrB family looped-hinge helix DNA binding protein
MVMARIKISTRGRVTLPKAVRDKLHWPAGTELIVEEKCEGVLLKAAAWKKAGSIADLAGILKYKGPAKTIEKMNAGVEQEFGRRHARGRY